MIFTEARKSILTSIKIISVDYLWSGGRHDQLWGNDKQIAKNRMFSLCNHESDLFIDMKACKLRAAWKSF